MKVWLFLLVGAIIAAVMQQDTGYVLLSWGLWTIELSLALLIVAIGILFTILYFGIRFIVRTWQLPDQVSEWNRRRGMRLAQQSLTDGLLLMSEGDWKSGEKSLLKYADRSETPLLNYLVAAKAAQLQGEYDRCDQYIQLAHDHMPSADVAVSLSQAEMQLADQQLDKALTTLKHLREVAPKHVYVLRLLGKLYEQVGDWERLKELLPELRKRKVLIGDRFQTMELKVHRALLEKASLSPDAAHLQHAWVNVPKKLRLDESILTDYVAYLLERDADTDAEPLLTKALKKHYSDNLIEVYGLVKGVSAGKQLSIAESHLIEFPKNAVLLLALGRLSLKAKLWGKARSYLNASIAENETIEAYRELGHLLENMNEQDAALDVYRKGILGLGGPELVALPEGIGQAVVTASNQDKVEAPLPLGVVE